MGMISITTQGSFPKRAEMFSAMEYGHAAAVAEAIEFLSKEVLPKAIVLDHKLHSQNDFPSEGFQLKE